MEKKNVQIKKKHKVCLPYTFVMRCNLLTFDLVFGIYIYRGTTDVAFLQNSLHPALHHKYLWKCYRVPCIVTAWTLCRWKYIYSIEYRRNITGRLCIKTEKWCKDLHTGMLGKRFLYRKFMKKGHTIHMDCTTYIQDIWRWHRRYLQFLLLFGCIRGEEPQITLCKFNYHNLL